MLKAQGIEVILGERLDLAPGKGVVKEGARITKIVMESGKTYAAPMFIDATYEGDLMARAGVKYHVGREDNATYGETLNGAQGPSHAHQIPPGVDPYKVKGDPRSGLLPGIEPSGPGEKGAGDKRVQAYNFRMCLTDVPENMLPIEKPEGYDPIEYELLLRSIETGKHHAPGSKFDMMPLRKTDVNNHGGVSTDYIGMNYDYPDGDYATREKIIARHKTYQLGYLWTLQNDPRVTEPIKTWYKKWGLPKDEFPATGHWTPQLYIREARRMIAGTVMNQHHCQGQEVAADSVGMGAYNMDSHNTRRYVGEDGFAHNEGDVQVGVPPYPISYQAIVPRQEECDNLFVPVCLSASHIAYGSIRMEPVFMVLGQSSAVAAVQAIEAKVPVQKLPYEPLQAALLKLGQVLTLENAIGGPLKAEPKTSGAKLDLKSLGGIVVDDKDAVKTGEWTEASTTGPFLGAGYVHDGAAKDGKASLKFTVKVEKPGDYELTILCPPNDNRASNAPVMVKSGGKETKLTFNGKSGAAKLGKITAAQEEVEILIGNQGADGYVVVDAVQLQSAEAK